MAGAAALVFALTALAACDAGTEAEQAGAPNGDRARNARADSTSGSTTLPDAATALPGAGAATSLGKNYRGRKDPGLVPPDEGTDNDAQLAIASAAYAEPTPDGKRSGVAPPYPELLEVSIEGLGTNFRITFTFAAGLPDKMPDEKAYMIVGVGMQSRRGDKASYAFGAQGTVQGWKPYGGGKTGASKFPGEFDVQGSRMVMTIPWKQVDGPHAFDWYANSAWFHTVGNVSSYLFDPLPNEPPAKFPN